MKRLKKKVRRSTKNRRLGSWMAMGALAVYTTTGKDGGSRLYAQQSVGNPATQAATLDLTLPERRFDIPAGPLDTALATFQANTGVKVLLHLPDGTIQGFRTQGVSGLMTPDAALQRLVENTGLSSTFLDAKNAVVEVAHASESVTVSAQALQLDLSNYTEPILDIPQTITVVPQSVMEEQQVTT